METQGILLLRKGDIELICSKEITFKRYKEIGGMFIQDKTLSDDAILAPGMQLHFLNRLFILEQGLMNDYFNSYIH